MGRRAREAVTAATDGAAAIVARTCTLYGRFCSCMNCRMMSGPPAHHAATSAPNALRDEVDCRGDVGAHAHLRPTWRRLEQLSRGGLNCRGRLCPLHSVAAVRWVRSLQGRQYGRHRSPRVRCGRIARATVAQSFRHPYDATPATYVPAVGASVIVEHTRGTSTSRRLAAVGRLRLNCRHVRNVGVARGNKRSESGEMMRGMDGSLDYWRRRAVFLATIVKTLRSTISPQWCGWGLVMSLYIWPLGYGEGQSLQLLHTNAKRVSKDLKKGFVVGAAQVGARWCGCDDDDSA